MTLFRLIAVVGLFASAGLLALPAAAQSLPEWAQPAQEDAARGGGFSFEDYDSTAPGPSLPDDPTPAPFGPAGLLLLGAAGAAYGVRRLRAR